MINLLMQGQVLLFASILIALIFSLTCHEFGHAAAAKYYGDRTAELQGRLTLNPLAHIDPVGLLMVMIVGFGYARPVPTNPRNYNSRWAQFGIAAAGPFANLLIAVIGWNLFLLGLKLDFGFVNNDYMHHFMSLLTGLNLLLMLFNLIPLGPLDGHYILPYFLPAPLRQRYQMLNRQYGILLFFGLILLSIAGVPIFSQLWQLAVTMIDYITFISVQ